MKIKLNLENYNKCLEFADLRTADSEKLYKSRGEKNSKKIYEDILNGVLAEWACHDYLSKLVPELSEPDMQIYEKRKKSFSPDLSSGNFKFHIKSQSKASADRYGASWLFQKTDKLFQRGAKDEFLVFAIVHQDHVEFLGGVSISDLVEKNLLAEPKVYQYRFSKVAIYFQDLINSGLDLSLSFLNPNSNINI